MSKDKHTPTPLTENEAVTRHDKGLFLISSNEHDGMIETIATLRADKAELIEALREAVKYVSYSEREKLKQTLAKYETK
jgi:hypothetical protein